ncbi:FAD-dependent oxidoreductase [Haloferula sargassicola]|uniref:FAD-dependent oxidoreductase n=1 Tax=Haloferula sargassicola TaxID=490096 RepID=A0ABP9UMK1_9BACT
MKADVLVIGGGSAGLAAAVTAARTGARVAVVERHGACGGMGTASLVHTFCGLYFQDTEQPEFANPGIASEIAERMQSITGLPPVKMGRVWVLPQHPVEFAALADAMLREVGVEVLFHCELVALEPGWRARVACRGCLFEIEATAVVDASGDAVAAAALGAEHGLTESAKLQRPAYVWGIQGVTPPIAGLELAGRIVEGVRAGDLDKSALGMHFRASGRPGEVFATLDLSGAETGDYDPTDPRCLATLEATGRRLAQSVLRYFRDRAAGWETAYISHWPTRAGVRESRRWIGEAVLTGEDVMAGRRRDDEVALASWPLELRETNRGPKLRYPEGPAGIPRGALVAKGFQRLFVAGRCLSCDHEAQASIRVMGTGFATGEAAGRLAAG